MPSSDPSSIASQPPSATPSDSTRKPLKWRLNLVLLLATIASVFFTALETTPAPVRSAAAVLYATEFTTALLVILGAHELGHFVAARIHRVEASLPYFSPLPPKLSLVCTLGAIIRIGAIPTRRALLDIGAAGPLAGLVFAIPLYAWGAAHSAVVPLSGEYMELGESVLLRLLDRAFAPTIPSGSDLMLHPIGLAAWCGMFVTMFNLLPVSQFDGGHVAYALFGPRQDRIARQVHRGMLVFFFVSLCAYVVRDLRFGFGLVRFGKSVGNSFVWLVWFEVLAILGTLASRSMKRNEEGLSIGTRVFSLVSIIGISALAESTHRPALWLAWAVAVALLLAMERRSGALRPHGRLDHPPTGAAPLDPTRKVIAWVTLGLFALLFMPTPLEM